MSIVLGLGLCLLTVVGLTGLEIYLASCELKCTRCGMLLTTFGALSLVTLLYLLLKDVTMSDTRFIAFALVLMIVIVLAFGGVFS